MTIVNVVLEGEDGGLHLGVLLHILQDQLTHRSPRSVGKPPQLASQVHCFMSKRVFNYKLKRNCILQSE